MILFISLANYNIKHTGNNLKWGLGLGDGATYRFHDNLVMDAHIRLSLLHIAFVICLCKMHLECLRTARSCQVLGHLGPTGPIMCDSPGLNDLWGTLDSTHSF